MPKTKTEGFDQETLELATMFKAMGHPARVAILRFLAESNACFCGNIVDALPLSQATVSQHLAELKQVGLIKGTIDGPRICYCIDTEAWVRVKAHLDQFLAPFVQCMNC
ncbi:MAG: metalloregulator ArsR/SmtB family transcription factor [Bacteroidia bacterium]